MNQSEHLERRVPGFFIPLEEFPVSLELKERILELMRLDEEGEFTSMDEMFFDMWMEDEHRNAFATADQLAALPSWKRMLRDGGREA